MKKKLKLLYVSHAPEDKGGAEISLKTLANQFKKNGHEVVYASLGKYSEFKTHVFKRFHPVYSFEIYEKYLARFFRRVIKKEKPDVIHANDRFVIIPAVMAAKKEGVPIVVHFRDFSLLTTATGLPYSQKHGYLNSFGYREILKTVPIKRLLWDFYKYSYIKRRYRIINQADVKICISRAIQEWVKKQGMKNSIIVNNPIVIDTPKKTVSKNEIRKKWGIPKDSPVILFIGGFSIGKGMDMILKIINKSNSLKKNVYFLLPGAGVDKEIIEELSKKNKRMIYLGKLAHDEIYKTYKVSDMVLLPSKYEPFSRIVIEAMYMGKPIISSNTGGGKEVITNGESGILVNPENVKEWINAINLLTDNKKLSGKFKSNYKKIIKRYSKESTYKEFYKIYREIIKK